MFNPQHHTQPYLQRHPSSTSTSSSSQLTHQYSSNNTALPLATGSSSSASRFPFDSPPPEEEEDEDEKTFRHPSSITTSNKSSVKGKGKSSSNNVNQDIPVIQPKKSNSSKKSTIQAQAQAAAQALAATAAMNANNATEDSAGDDDKKKQRSSKACDACRRQKCKCQRILNDDGQEDGPCQNCRQNNLECTFLVTSKKRGPPKGYIEAIENRMHRMEALLGGLLNNDDPRAQALLEELVGDIEARELLSKDLAAAAAVGRDNAPLLKSWQRPTAAPALKREDSVQPMDLSGSLSASSQNRAAITQRGFDAPGGGTGGATGSSAFSTSLSNAGVSVENTPFNGEMHKAAWIPDDELLGGSDTSPSFSAIGLDASMDFDAVHPARSFETTGGIGIGAAAGASSSSNANANAAGSLSGSFASSALNIPSSNPFGGTTPGVNEPGTSAFASTFSTSPRQRRKLDMQIAGSHSGQGGNSDSRKVSGSGSGSGAQASHNLFSRQHRTGGQVPAPDSILHTGAAYFNLTGAASSMSPGASAGDKSPDTAADGLSPGVGSNNGGIAGSTGTASQQDGPLSELADVVGQLSLDDTKEVRYHGRSSGLYLISKSARYQDFFWRFPKPGAWQAGAGAGSQISGSESGTPGGRIQHENDEAAAREANADPYAKTEAELVKKTKAYEVMPDKRTSDHFLELYWTYVHPHLPLLYRSLFVRQYRNTVHSTDGYCTSAKENDGSSGSGNGSAPGTSAGGSSGGKPAPALASGGKVPAILLLAIYALAARYSDTGEGTRKEGEYWKAGEVYAVKARELLYEDFGSSRLTTCQALLLLAYREAGVGAMAKSWTYVGMAIRMAQDLGLFRDVDKWFLPVNAFGYEEKQTRKRVWWSCVILDRYISAYIGRPMAIFERDYDVALPAEDEPDEHDIWRPLRPDGTDWSDPPIMNTEGDQVLASIRNYPQGVKSNSLSCFNHSASLSVLFSRIIANLYAIRVRVLGQNSETLLAHLDQALATWWLKLPAHLQYNSASKRVPPPHVLTLHCQFYAALILLHRPFIPAQGSPRTNQTFPSHSICTTAAAAISNIVTLYSKTYGLRQAVPFMVYYIFSAGIMHFYNSTYDESLALTAKAHLVRCMNALKEMQITWGSASRQRELLIGIVDIQDPEYYASLDALNSGDVRGRKREAEYQDVESLPGSGRGTPSATSTGRGSAMDVSSHFSNNPPRGPFASTQISHLGGTAPAAQQGPAQTNARRTTSQTNQKNQVAQKRRHNSISAAGLRQQPPTGVSHIADMRIQHSNTPAAVASPSTNMPNLNSLFPSGDFTFMSPPAPTTQLPMPSPSWGKVGGFEFSQTAPQATETSPSSTFFNFTSPPMIPPASDFSSHDNQHISNILGLTSPNDVASAASVQSNNYTTNNLGNSSNINSNANIMSNMNPALNQTLPGTGAFGSDMTLGQQDQNSQPRFGDIAEFLFDPFWQSQMRQINMQGSNNNNDGLANFNMAGSINFEALAGLSNGQGMQQNGMSTGPMFNDTQPTDLFGGNMPTEYNNEEWQKYFNSQTPNQN